ncbi:MAG: hypothetical protein AAF801_12740 [Pseudomonadota bacterium]
MASLTKRFDPIDADALDRKAKNLTDDMERQIVADTQRREQLFNGSDGKVVGRLQNVVRWREPQRP